MNIDVAGRIRPSIRGEPPTSLDSDAQGRIASEAGGTYYTYQPLYGQEASNYDVFKTSVEPLVDLFVAGFNTCLMVTGPSGSGKGFAVAGESNAKAGILPICLEHLFSKIGEDPAERKWRSNQHDRFMFDNRLNPSSRVSMEVFEVYNEMVKDLQQVPGVKTEFLECDESPERGAFAKGAMLVPLSSSSEGVSQFRAAWAHRTDIMSDYGPAKSNAAVIIRLHLNLQTRDSPLPNKSYFTLVVTPGTEKLANDSNELRQREGPTLSKPIVSLSQLAAALGNQQYPDRDINYGESKLTWLLRDELGGNCKTRVLVCFKPQTESSVLTPLLRFSSHLATIKNFPVLNDPFAQGLQTQYRSQVLSLKQQLGLGVTMMNPMAASDLHDELRRLQTENLALRDKNERIHNKLDGMQGTFGMLATTKTDLSAQLLMTEEEKLKVSKTLVEMQIENNKLKEEVEAAKFELTNKILQLENRVMEVETDRDRHQKAAKNARDKLSEVERDRKELADEYVVLKTNFLNMQKAHEKEVARNEELSVELLNMVNAKAALMRQWEGRDMSYEAAQEVERIKAIVSRLNSRRTDELMASLKDRSRVEDTLFGNQRRFQSEIERMRSQYDDDQRNVEAKMSTVHKELNDARNLARERSKKLAELNAQMITMRDNNNVLQSENNRLQHKLKDVNEDFRGRLVQYVHDISHYVDTGGLPDKKRDQSAMKKYVEEMLKDLKRSYKLREEQLADAATKYKKRSDEVVAKHEELLVAYRELRLTLESQGLTGHDLGPDETRLQFTNTELISQQQREINRLRTKLNETVQELENAKLRLRTGGAPVSTVTKDPAATDNEWSSLRKQLREFTMNTQQELERERADLMSKNVMLEEQVKELSDYIDSHLARYKDEISRLRQMLGTGGTSGFTSPPAPPGNHRHNHRR